MDLRSCRRNPQVRPGQRPPGFRRLSLLGATSAGIDPFADVPDDEAGARAAPHDGLATLCADLFDADRVAPAVVPIAFFPDFDCPNCELPVDNVRALSAADPQGVHVRRQEWPIPDEGSETTVRAALAAGLQGAHDAFARRLQGAALTPTPATPHGLAGSAGIDAERLLRDMASEAVGARLATTLALVRRLGFTGKPAFVVGRTIVVGTIRTSTLGARIAAERALGPPPFC